ncbi:MAG: lysophospholipid acyltransferase family protein [Pseudomonadota bacterium]
MARKNSLHPFVQSLLTAAAASYIRLLNRTLRWDVRGEEHHEKLITSGKAFIYAFWHSRLLMMPRLQKHHNLPISVLISEHGDGELLARTMDHFNIIARRGSAQNPRKKQKQKGGASALKALVKDAKNGIVIGLTPDGPRGPRQRAQAGVAQLARLAGVPVLPTTYNVKVGKRLKSWDRLILPLPLPFSKAVFIYGEPIYVKDDIEKGRQDIEASLNHITEKADLMVGQDYSPPAPLMAQGDIS